MTDGVSEAWEAMSSGADAEEQVARPTTAADAATSSMLEGIERLHTLVLAIDDGGRVVWASDAIALACGGAKRILARPVRDVLGALGVGREAGLALGAMSSALARGERPEPTRISLGNDHEGLQVEVNAFGARDGRGEPLWVFLAERAAETVEPAADDQTERQQQLSFILDAIPDGILTIDRLGFVTSANAAAGRLLGHAAADLVDHPLSNFVTEMRHAEAIAESLAAHGEVHAEELEVVRADGSRAWLSISAAVRGVARTTGETGEDDERARQSVVIIRDVSDRHEARRQLELKNEELEGYARNVSHDLRSPLVALLGFTRLLRDDVGAQLPTSGLHFLDRIEEAGRNMQRMLHDLLELSRIGAKPAHRVHVDPRRVLAQIASERKLTLDEAGIELRLPEVAPTLLCDRTRLYQLLSNLIGNAIKHMGERSDGRIEVSIDEVDDGWQIVVADNGPGIRPEYRERIFEMFETLRPAAAADAPAAPWAPTKPSRSPRSKSSGLGLAIVKKIVDSHGGRVHVEGEPGEGARFVVFLAR